ncbi:MAG: peptide ABC transporter substrate-binding protein [Alphaproteobacteria bacterium]|nr:peptide ABC transporter substrate-binding protein [Alphaproteobacteria bacterium]
MRRFLRSLAAIALLAATAGLQGAQAQNFGGILRIPHLDSPASMSIHEESTIATLAPMMGVFNNLVMFDQHVKQNSLSSIVPDLASAWSSNEEGTKLTFTLRQGVKWHDGKPFTARDVQCTWDLLTGKANEKLRVNPRRSWYRNLDEVTVDSDYQVNFHLKRPQPAFIALLASGWSPVYPCHVSPRDMRTHPIGTGPFKFVEFKPNEVIRVARNPDYWKPGRPFLDGIEYTIIKNPSTAIMAFAAGNFDRYAVGILSLPLMKQIKSQAPQAICEVVPWNIPRMLLINRAAPPFDNPDLRRAIALTLDRQAFIDILSDGQGSIGGAMMPPPAGAWGMPPEVLATLPTYGPDAPKNRAEARAIMQKLGYGPDKRLSVTVTTRNVQAYRDPSVLLIDQLKEIYIDGILDAIDTPQWYPKVMRKDYMIGVTVGENGLDDPDQQFYENYACGSERNYTGYCSPETDQLIDRQSMETDPAERKQIVWEIERKLAEDGARPIIFYPVSGACWQPQFHGHTMMVNGNYNGWRLEDAWLDK